MNTEAIIKQAEALQLGGSLTFKMLVIQRDWPAVEQMLPTQKDALHQTSTISEIDREWLRQEAQKDDYTLAC